LVHQTEVRQRRRLFASFNPQKIESSYHLLGGCTTPYLYGYAKITIFASDKLGAETVISPAKRALDVHQIFASRRGADFCVFRFDAKVLIFGSDGGQFPTQLQTFADPERLCAQECQRIQSQRCLIIKVAGAVQGDGPLKSVIGIEQM
jgi:hypothetical protein